MNITKYVLGFALSKDKTKILMIKKTKPAWQEGLLNAIGGKIESYDENFYFALAREFKEETDLDTNPQDWNLFNIIKAENFEMHCMYGYFDHLDSFVTTTEEEVFLMDIDTLLANKFEGCVPNLKWIIPLVLDKDIKNLRLNTHYIA